MSGGSVTIVGLPLLDLDLKALVSREIKVFKSFIEVPARKKRE